MTNYCKNSFHFDKMYNSGLEFCYCTGFLTLTYLVQFPSKRHKLCITKE